MRENTMFLVQSVCNCVPQVNNFLSTCEKQKKEDNV